MKRLCLILLVVPAFAQIQNNGPRLFYSQPGNLIAEPDYQLHLHQNVSIGDCLVVSSEFQDVFGRGHSNYPVTDSLGNSFTNLATVSSGVNYIYTSYANVTVAGTDVLFSSIPSVAALDQEGVRDVFEDVAHLGAIGAGAVEVEVIARRRREGKRVARHALLRFEQELPYRRRR